MKDAILENLREVEEFVKYTRDPNEICDVITRSTRIHFVKSIQAAELLLKNDVHINTKNEDGLTCLFYIEDSDLFKFMVNKGASINIRDRNGNTLLFYKKNYEIVNFLLEKGLNPNFTNKYGETALYNCESLEIVKLFFKYSYEIKNPKIFFRTRNNDILEFLLTSFKKNFEIVNEFDETPMFFTANEERIKILSKHININKQNTKGETVLHVMKDPDVIKLLLELGADPTIENKEGVSPVFNENPSIIRLYIDKQPDLINSIDSKGESLLFKIKDVDTIKYLLEKGIDVNIKNSEGKTVLHCIQDPEIAELYLKFGASLRTKDSWNRIPLFYFSSTEMLKWFLSRGSKKDSKDRHSLRPIFFAKDLEQLKIFEEYKTDAECVARSGKTPLFFYNSLEMTKYAIDNMNMNPLHKDIEGRTAIYYLSDLETIKHYLSLGVNPEDKDETHQTFLEFNKKINSKDNRILSRVIYEISKDRDSSDTESDNDTFEMKDSLVEV